MIYTDVISQQKLADTLGISRIEVRRLTEKGIFVLDEHKKLSLSQAKEAYERYRKLTIQPYRQKKRRLS